MKDDVISSSLWRWRTEALSGGFGLAWGLWDVSARVKVDREGIAACDLWLRYEGRTAAGTEPRLKAAAQLYLLDTESVEDEDVESGVFDIDESDWNDGESVGLSRIAASAGSLAFKRLKLGAGLAWGKSANRGRADLSLNVSANDDGLGLTIAGEFFQSLGIGSRSVLGLSLASPSGGYDLDRPPDAFPNIGLDFTVSEGMKAGG